MKPASFVLVSVIVVGSSSVVCGGGLPGLPRGLDAADLYESGEPSAGFTLVGDRLDALASLGPAPAAGLATAVAPSALGADDDRGGSYIVGRIGPMWFVEDFEDFDVGLNFEVAFGFRPIRFLALEFQSGYFWGEDDGTADAEVWGIPFFVNAKGILPLFFLEIYGGVGIGGYYIETEASSALLSGEDEDFVFAWDAFVGAGFTLGPLALGLEGKYIHTDEFDAPGSRDPNLQAFALMAYLAFSF